MTQLIIDLYKLIDLNAERTISKKAHDHLLWATARAQGPFGYQIRSKNVQFGLERLLERLYLGVHTTAVALVFQPPEPQQSIGPRRMAVLAVLLKNHRISDLRELLALAGKPKIFLL